MAAVQTFQNIGNVTDTNFPLDEEGRTYHVGTKMGEVANRIILVGEPGRAELIVKSFDGGKEYFKRVSNRGFITYTGKMDGKDVSVISIGMGKSMMDFTVREVRAVTKGPLAFIRLGSCGTPAEDVEISTVFAASQSISIDTDYNAYDDEAEPLEEDKANEYYRFSKPVFADLKLHQLMVNALKQQAQGKFPVKEGMDATADFFYSSQGREDPAFDDRNKGIIEKLMKKHPNTGSLQMEHFQLFHLARIAKKRDIKVAACAIVLANRPKGQFLSIEEKHEIEVAAGRACLKAVANFEME